MFKNKKKSETPFQNLGPTEGFVGGGFITNPTEPPNMGGFPGEFNETIGFEDPVDDSSKFDGFDSDINKFEDTEVTHPFFESSIPGFMPVVGWLVCIDGPERGRDYRLHAGYNSIGRSLSNDVNISGDNKISRDNHAQIAYDDEGHVFYFSPFKGKNLVRVNGKLIMMPHELKAYDVLLIGSSKFSFIPFCGEKFSWTE